MKKFNNIKSGTWIYFVSDIGPEAQKWIVLFDGIKRETGIESPELWSYLAVSRNLEDEFRASFVNINYCFNTSVYNPRPATADEITWALQEIQRWYFSFSEKPLKIFTHILCSHAQILKNSIK